MTIENASTVICSTEHVEHLLHCIVCYMWDVRTKLQTEIEPLGENVSALHIVYNGANAGLYQDQAYNFARGYLALLNCQRQDAMQQTRKLTQKDITQ